MPRTSETQNDSALRALHDRLERLECILTGNHDADIGQGAMFTYRCSIVLGGPIRYFGVSPQKMMDGEEQNYCFHVLLSARYDTGREGQDFILFCDVRLDPWQK